MSEGERIYRQNLRRILLDIQFYLLFEGLKNSLFENRESLSPVFIKRQIIENLKSELATDGHLERSSDTDSVF